MPDSLTQDSQAEAPLPAKPAKAEASPPAKPANAEASPPAKPAKAEASPMPKETKPEAPPAAKDPKPEVPPAAKDPKPETPLSPKDLFIDRELSWLGFNQRVLDEALDARLPLLERCKFLAIVASNLDEFFEVRVAALLQKAESHVLTDGIAALPVEEKLDTVLKTCQKMVRQQYKCWNEDLLPRLREKNIHVLDMASLSKEDERFLDDYFRREVYHLLTPIKVDPAHPFPAVQNKALCLAVLLKEDQHPRSPENLGVITIPRSLPRVIAITTREAMKAGQHRFVFLYPLVERHIAELFKGYQIKGCAGFRVTRNSNLYLEEEEGDSLIDAVEAVVHNRRKGNAVRLEIDKGAPKRIVDALLENFDLDPDTVFRVNGPVNLNRLMALSSLMPLPQLKFPQHTAHNPLRGVEGEELLGLVGEKDVFLHHPFESFDPVVRFIQAAAEDPKVLAIKQTLYRTNENSPVMHALIEAAEMGKEVIAVVELKARFDEKSNINWARRLEEKGGTVLYGLVGLKTHCKLSLLIRKEDGGFRQYAHVGTGNYNPDTARLYTDLSLLTADPEITASVAEVFNFLTSQSRTPDFRSLLVGPLNFLKETVNLIRREAEAAREGKACGITAKMNALLDKEVIEALYEASQAGVSIRLIVRGICALRPGVKGLSENITVKSVVGRFLEHSRIFHFENGGMPLLYVGSSDWMERNLRERVEVLVPLRDPRARASAEEILSVYWADNLKARLMKGDGSYHQLQPAEGEAELDAQVFFLRRAESDPALPAVKSLFPARKEAEEAEGGAPL